MSIILLEVLPLTPSYDLRVNNNTRVNTYLVVRTDTKEAKLLYTRQRSLKNGPATHVLDIG